MDQNRRPRLYGPEDLLALKEPLGGKTPFLVFFTDKEFKKLLSGAVELTRRPRAPGMVFLPVPGGMVQGACDSPPGQICVGQWTPAGPDHGAGIFFGCKCRIVDGRVKPPTLACQFLLNASGRLVCEGGCDKPGHKCTKRAWRDPQSGQVFVDCVCAPLVLKPA